jgi:hypothetical protein
MKTILFPLHQRLARNFLREQLPVFGLDVPVVTKNPSSLPKEWIKLRSQGGPRDLVEWRAMLDIYVYSKDEVKAEGIANTVHSLMLDAPGVLIKTPEYSEPYPWIRLARHISGPTSLNPDDDLPHLEPFRIVSVWHILPIPRQE